MPRPDIPKFDALPIPTTAAGALRDVGIEVEFAGLSERAAAGVIARVKNPYLNVAQAKVRGTNEVATGSGWVCGITRY